MAIQVPIHLLFDPTSSQHGKFYLVALDPQAHFSIHGANTPSNAGILVPQASLNAAQKILSSKLKKGYQTAQPHQITRPALQQFAARVCTLMGLPPDTSHTFVNGTLLQLNTADAGAQPPRPNTGARPRVRAKDSVNVWF